MSKNHHPMGRWYTAYKASRERELSAPMPDSTRFAGDDGATKAEIRAFLSDKAMNVKASAAFVIVEPAPKPRAKKSRDLFTQADESEEIPEGPAGDLVTLLEQAATVADDSLRLRLRAAIRDIQANRIIVL